MRARRNFIELKISDIFLTAVLREGGSGEKSVLRNYCCR